MLPLSDDVKARRFPVVNVALIVANTAVWLVYELPNLDAAVAHSSFHASGAIAAVLGAYFVLYPNLRIRTFLGWLVVAIPAWIFLGGWFPYQLIEANFGCSAPGRAAAWRSSPTWAGSSSGTSSRGRWCARGGSRPGRRQRDL